MIHSIGFNYAFLILLAIVHVVLCIVPATQRGYPTLNPFVEFAFPLISLIGGAILVVNTIGNPLIHRWITKSIFCFVYSLGVGAAVQFRLFGHAVPNHGPYLIEAIAIAAVILPSSLLILLGIEWGLSWWRTKKVRSRFTAWCK